MQCVEPWRFRAIRGQGRGGAGGLGKEVRNTQPVECLTPGRGSRFVMGAESNVLSCLFKEVCISCCRFWIGSVCMREGSAPV
jgi:hypothetical protein